MNDSVGSKIVVGVDGSTPSLSALRRAAKISSQLGIPIEALTTWDFPVMMDAFAPPLDWTPEDIAKEVQQHALDAAFPAGIPEGLEQVIAMGPPARALIERSQGAYLLVLGSRGRGGFAGLLLGSVSAACAAHAKCPVLIMHGDEPEVQDPEAH